MPTRFPDPTDTWTDDDARLVLDEWRQGGDSIAAFARKHGVTAARLYWWKKRLGSSPAGPTLSLVAATIVGREATIAIRLPGDIVIEVANASPSWVAAIVAELTRSA